MTSTTENGVFRDKSFLIQSKKLIRRALTSVPRKDRTYTNHFEFIHTACNPKIQSVKIDSWDCKPSRQKAEAMMLGFLGLITVYSGQFRKYDINVSHLNGIRQMFISLAIASIYDRAEDMFKAELEYFVSKAFGNKIYKKEFRFLIIPKIFRNILNNAALNCIRKQTSKTRQSQSLWFCNSLQYLKKSWNAISDKKMFNAFKDTLKILTTPNPTDKLLDKRLLSKVFDTTSNFIFKSPFSGRLVVPTPGASIESFRKEGGNLGYMYSRIGDEEYISSDKDMDNRTNLVLFYEKLTKDYVDNYILNPNADLPKVQVMQIPEPSKVRTLSKPESSLSSIVRPVQRWLLDNWANQPFSTFKGNVSFEDVEKIFAYPLICNIDYKDATNLLSFDVSQIALASAIRTLPESFQAVAKTCFGPAWIDQFIPKAKKLINRFKKYHTAYALSGLFDDVVCSNIQSYLGNPLPEQLEQKRGQLMGNPLSFPILCLINYTAYVCLLCKRHNIPLDDIENYLYWNDNSRTRRFKKQLKDCLFNGDDGSFGIFNMKEYAIWKEIVSSFGFKISPGKNFVSEDIVIINSRLFHRKMKYVNYLNLAVLYRINIKKGNTCHKPDELAGTYKYILDTCPERYRLDVISQLEHTYKDLLTRPTIVRLKKKKGSFSKSLNRRKKSHRIMRFKRNWTLPFEQGGLGLGDFYQDKVTLDHKIYSWIRLTPQFSELHNIHRDTVAYTIQTGDNYWNPKTGITKENRYPEQNLKDRTSSDYRKILNQILDPESAGVTDKKVIYCPHYSALREAATANLWPNKLFISPDAYKKDVVDRPCFVKCLTDLI